MNKEFEKNLVKAGMTPDVVITEITPHATDVFMCLHNIGFLMVHDATYIDYSTGGTELGRDSFYDMMFCKIASSTMVYTK